jgi:putative ABC transport system permease protein
MLHLRLTIRSLLKNRLMTFLNIIGLSTGFIIFIIVSLWIKQALSIDKSFNQKDLIYRIVSTKLTDKDEIESAFTPYGLAPLISTNFPEILSIGRLSLQNDFELRINNVDMPPKYALADNEFLKIFNIKLIQGDSMHFFDNPNSMIINENAYRTLLNDNDLFKLEVISKKFKSNVGPIVGVYKDLPSNSHLKLGIIGSIDQYKIMDPRGYNYHWSVYTYVKLKAGVRIPELERKISEYYNNSTQNQGFVPSFKFEPLNDIYLSSSFEDDHVVHGNKRQIIIFSCIIIFILLISLINYVNLSTSLGETRVHEIGIQKIMGASKIRLLFIHIFESILISFFSAVLGIIVSVLIIPLIDQILKIHISIGSWGNSYYIAGLFFFFILTGLISGIYPAIKIARQQTVNTSGGFYYNVKKKDVFRKSLVVIQYFISLVLISSTIIVYQQLNYLRNINQGIANKDIITIPFNSQYNYDYLKSEFLQIKGVEKVSISVYNPTNISKAWYGFNWEGKPKENKLQFYMNAVSFDYIETYQIPVIAGRSFSTEYPSDDSSAFIVNEECAHQMGFVDPIGKRMSFGNKNGRIIGVIKNYSFQSFKRKIDPLVLFIDPESWSQIHLKVDPMINKKEVLLHIKKVWEELNPSETFTYILIEDEFSEQYKDELMLSKALIYFTLIAIIIAILGIIGLILHLIEKDKKEIAIRKIHGASSLAIHLKFSLSHIYLMVIALLFTIPTVIYFLNKWLHTFEIHIKIGPQHFISSIFFLGILSQLVLFRIIRKANRINPAEVLAQS